MDTAERDILFLKIAKMVSSFGTCPTKQVGCVIVDGDSIISSGYNDSPIGVSKCGEACMNRDIGENSKLCKAVHAEMNAILNAASRGVSVKGATVYVTISPCQSCARAIIQTGIREVVCSALSPYGRAIELLNEAGVAFRAVHTLSQFSPPIIE